MSDPGRGFTYHLDWEVIEKYRAWPVERKLAWLMAGNRLRAALPERIRAIQDAFRHGTHDDVRRLAQSPLKERP